MYADAVIEGGGVKGIGLVGAIYEAEKKGYEWKRLAGTSAGSIIASLLAAGYSAEELKEEVMTLDYSKFIEKKGVVKIPFFGYIFNLWFRNGVFSGEYIEEWMRKKLNAKGIQTFSDLKKPLSIIASDITNGEMLVLPRDITNYNMDPDSLDIARAVRMSSSLPYFFQPIKIKTFIKGKKVSNYIVDGGLLSNFPVWIFDNHHTSPKWPTFGFRLTSEDTGKPNRIKGPISMGFALISTMLEAHDMRHIKQQDYMRTILVPSLGIKTTDFHLTREESEKLFQSGQRVGKEFFDSWDFQQYIFKYRSTKVTRKQK